MNSFAVRFAVSRGEGAAGEPRGRATRAHGWHEHFERGRAGGAGGEGGERRALLLCVSWTNAGGPSLLGRQSTLRQKLVFGE